MPGPRLAPGALLLGSVALLLGVVPFGLLLFLVEDRWVPLLRLDVLTRDALHGFALDHSGFTGLMRLLSWSGSTAAWFAVFGVVALVLLLRGHLRLALFAVVTVGGSSLLNSTVKAAVGRTRPVFADPLAQAGGWSFPSGHAQAAVVGYAVLVLLLFLLVPSPAASRWRVLVHVVVYVVAPVAAAVMVLGIGFSRIALGVHYLSDVLAGYVLGTAWVVAMIAAFGVVGPGPAVSRRPIVGGRPTGGRGSVISRGRRGGWAARR
jgi:membrane-associated phospholipid phosphatase